MRSSPLSLTAESVFQYDLERELITDLKRLRKKASDDGDVVFILPDQSSVWAHSPLFYIAANKLPTTFGIEAGTAKNDRGVTVKMLFVSEEKIAEFNEVINTCYSIENLALLWKATGGDEVKFGLDSEHKHMEMDTSGVKSTLPASLLPDFEIHLRGDGNELVNEPRFSLKVHRFLLDARITYYRLKTRAGLKLRDATPMSSNLSRTIFTEFSLWSIAMYVYCGIPSTIFSLDPNLQDYITEPEIRDTRTKKSSHCNEFRNKKRLPAEGIECGLLEIARAANFLLAPELDNWAHFQLYRLAHRFQCTGGGCAEIIPFIIDAIYRNDITDEWLFNTGISWLARYENIPHLWKWSLLYKFEVIPLLIEKIMETDWENSFDGATKSRRGENAIELFVRLWKLKQYTSMTKDSDKWNNELIEPLMNYSVQIVVADLSNSITFNRLETLLDGMSFSKLAGEELLANVIDLECIKGSFLKDWSVVEKLLELCEKKQAADSAKQRRANIPPVNMQQILPAEEQFLFQENEPSVPMEKIRWDEGLDETQGVIRSLELRPEKSISSPMKRGGKGKKPVDARLKGSATPFVPGKITKPLETLYNLGSVSENPQESCREFELHDTQCLSGSDKSFGETVVHAKQQGFKIRRMMSTPVAQTNEPSETPAGVRKNQNRSCSNPIKGEEVPSGQQILKYYQTQV